MARVLLGYAGMILSSAATLVAILAAGVICTANHISIGLIFFAFANPFSILAFMVAGITALIYSSIPFTIFIVIGELKHVRCLAWYLTAAFVTVILFFLVPLPYGNAIHYNSKPVLGEIILSVALVVVQAAVGTFAYWKIAGRFAGTKDEQMYGPF